MLDDADSCPTRGGMVNGCPPRIVARVNHGYAAVSNGVTVNGIRLRVNGRKVTTTHKCVPPASTVPRRSCP